MISELFRAFKKYKDATPACISFYERELSRCLLPFVRSPEEDDQNFAGHLQRIRQDEDDRLVCGSVVERDDSQDEGDRQVSGSKITKPSLLPTFSNFLAFVLYTIHPGEWRTLNAFHSHD